MTLSFMRLLYYNPLHSDIATLLLRLLLGGMFTYYGYQKLSMYDHLLNTFGDVIGIGSELSFHLVIFAELICGFLVLVGFFTRLSVLPISFTMIVAYFVVHAKDSFEIKQLALIYLLISITIFFLGSGKYSIDALLQRKKYAKQWYMVEDS